MDSFSLSTTSNKVNKMASYSATMFKKSATGYKVIAGSGSFANISIDGRLSMAAAIEVARENLKKEAGKDYIGFAIEKTSRFVDYKNAVIVDSQLKAKEVLFLL